MPGAKLKFPNSRDFPPSTPAVMCPAARVIGLYNQKSRDKAKKIAKKVRERFFVEAPKHGWAGVHFIPEVQSNNGAGCVLWRPPDKVDVTITVTKETLVLLSGSAER